MPLRGWRDVAIARLGLGARDDEDHQTASATLIGVGGIRAASTVGRRRRPKKPLTSAEIEQVQAAIDDVAAWAESGPGMALNKAKGGLIEAENGPLLDTGKTYSSPGRKGRPLCEIDWAEADRLRAEGKSWGEVAKLLGVNRNTLLRHREDVPRRPLPSPHVLELAVQITGTEPPMPGALLLAAIFWYGYVDPAKLARVTTLPLDQVSEQLERLHKSGLLGPLGVREFRREHAHAVFLLTCFSLVADGYSDVEERDGRPLFKATEQARRAATHTS